MPAAVNDDAEAARTSLARLETLRAELLLPGHGDPSPGSPAAVAAARAVMPRR
jgi:glyoxylase-like metal-dependent hydrolase (beta-lactamase superfamily II)